MADASQRVHFANEFLARRNRAAAAPFIVNDSRANTFAEFDCRAGSALNVLKGIAEIWVGTCRTAILFLTHGALPKLGRRDRPSFALEIIMHNFVECVFACQGIGLTRLTFCLERKASER